MEDAILNYGNGNIIKKIFKKSVGPEIEKRSR